ncbi:MAG: hypothetical protein ABDH32_07070 [Candidatus Caldarchaeales archaeon]
MLVAVDRNAKLVTDDAKLTSKMEKNIDAIIKILEKKLEVLSSDKIQHLCKSPKPLTPMQHN